MTPAGRDVLGLGIDAVEIPRFARMLERRPGLIDRLFTATERLDRRGRLHRPSSLAARFCAKEATMKALGVGLGAVDFHDISVEATVGPPRLVLNGRAQQLAQRCRLEHPKVSLTHTETTAMAVVHFEYR